MAPITATRTNILKRTHLDARYVLSPKAIAWDILLGVLDQRTRSHAGGAKRKTSGRQPAYGVTRQLLVRTLIPLAIPTHGDDRFHAGLDAASMSRRAGWFKTYFGPNNVPRRHRCDITPKSHAKKSKNITAPSCGPPVVTAAWSQTHRHSSRFGAGSVPQRVLSRVDVPQADSPEEGVTGPRCAILARQDFAPLQVLLQRPDRTRPQRTNGNKNSRAVLAHLTAKRVAIQASKTKPQNCNFLKTVPAKLSCNSPNATSA